MAISTYSEIQAKVADYLSDSSLTDQIKDFITQAEIRLRRELRVRQMLKVVETATTGGDSTVTLPPDFLQIRDIHLVTNPVGVLEYQSPSAFFRNTASTTSGQPRQYTILANEFQFAPAPDGAYTIRMLYYAAPEFLSDTNPTNIFTQICPDLLIYGALGEAEPYMMNDARLTTWATLYDRGLEALGVSDDQAEWSASPLAISIASR